MFLALLWPWGGGLIKKGNWKMQKVNERNQSSPLTPLCSIMCLLCLIIFFHQKSLRNLGCKISQVRIRQKAMGVEEGTKELRSLK